NEGVGASDSREVQLQVRLVSVSDRLPSGLRCSKRAVGSVQDYRRLDRVSDELCGDVWAPVSIRRWRLLPPFPLRLHEVLHRESEQRWPSDGLLPAPVGSGSRAAAREGFVSFAKNSTLPEFRSNREAIREVIK